MTPRSPSSCLYAVSSIKYSTHHHAAARLAIIYQPFQFRQFRQYAQQQQPPSNKPTSNKPTSNNADSGTSIARTALAIIESNTKTDPVNPPRSVLPPHLVLPERSEAQTVFVYWFRIGRAYGNFYKEGIKAVWYNYKAAKALQERIKSSTDPKTTTQDAAVKGLITRAEWQLLARNDHDVGKLPFFGVLVLIFGEWLPLLVPFMPGVVPGTCRIPKQVLGMKVKAEERRRASFRQGITEPEEAQMPDDRVVVAGRPAAERAEWPLASEAYMRSLLAGLRSDQLYHVSSSLGLHSRLWDRVQLPPPQFLLRRALAKRLRYLAIDDKLLLEDDGVPKLTSVELDVACQERGLDTLNKKEPALRDSLASWLKCQKEDHGRGRAMLSMLFRRPNSWQPVLDRITNS